jgi:hypothetical protein
MKVFKNLHPYIPNGATIKDMGTFHGVNKGLVVARHIVCDDLSNQEINIQEKNENIGDLKMTFVITMDRSVGLRDLIDEVFNDIKIMTFEIPMLQLHLLLALKLLKGKQQDMIVRGIASFKRSEIDPFVFICS